MTLREARYPSQDRAALLVSTSDVMEDQLPVIPGRCKPGWDGSGISESWGKKLTFNIVKKKSSSCFA